MKTIPNNVIDTVKKLVNTKLSNFKYVLLDSYYPVGNNYTILLTVITESSSKLLIEKERFAELNLIVKYLPKNSFYNLNRHLDYYKYLIPCAHILKDENSFLVNLKTSFIYQKEIGKVLVSNDILDELRWEITGFYEGLNLFDNDHIRYKIVEKFVNFYNIIGDIYIDLSFLPFIIESIKKDESYYFDIERILKSDVHDVKSYIKNLLKPFQGLSYVQNVENINYKNDICVRIETKECDLESFLESFFIKFVNLVKKYSSEIEKFYWERIDINNYELRLQISKDVNQDSGLFEEMRLKFSNTLQIKFTKPKLSPIYNLFDEFYSGSLHKLAEYLIDLKFNESEIFIEDLSISYAIELYISCFIEMGIGREEFFKFNSHVSQKWHVLFLPDEELFTSSFTTSNKLYRHFEDLFNLHRDDIYANYKMKLENWENSTTIFKDELESLSYGLKTINSDVNYSSLLNIINGANSVKNEKALSFLEGFTYKIFGLMGLNLEKKLYITYIINQISNEY